MINAASGIVLTFHPQSYPQEMWITKLILIY